jgi:hypothetical protein
MPLTSEQKRRKKVSTELSKLPLKTLEDYKKYNEKCKALGVPVKPAPPEIHENVKVKFLRRDGMTHAVKLKFRNGEIDFEKKVEHGHIYEIPKIVVKQYQKLGIPKYKRLVNHNTGESETVFSHKDPRFAFQIVLDD